MCPSLISQERDTLTRSLSLLCNAANQCFFPVEHVAWAADNKMLDIKSDRLWTAGLVLWATSLATSILRWEKGKSHCYCDVTWLLTRFAEITDNPTIRPQLIKANNIKTSKLSIAGHLWGESTGWWTHSGPVMSDGEQVKFLIKFEKFPLKKMCLEMSFSSMFVYSWSWHSLIVFVLWYIALSFSGAYELFNFLASVRQS